MLPNLEISIDEVYIIIGELEVTRRKLNQQLQQSQKQIGEMSDEITKLRKENFELQAQVDAIPDDEREAEERQG